MFTVNADGIVIMLHPRLDNSLYNSGNLISKHIVNPIFPNSFSTTTISDPALFPENCGFMGRGVDMLANACEEESHPTLIASNCLI